MPNTPLHYKGPNKRTRTDRTFMWNMCGHQWNMHVTEMLHFTGLDNRKIESLGLEVQKGKNIGNPIYQSNPATYYSFCTKRPWVSKVVIKYVWSCTFINQPKHELRIKCPWSAHNAYLDCLINRPTACQFCLHQLKIICSHTTGWLLRKF